MQDLAQARADALERQNLRFQQQQYHIRIGMGTCGIAVGAHNVLETIQRLLSSATTPGVDPAQVSLTQIGCIGLCALEPIVQVLSPDRTQVTYGKVTPAVARRIIEEHIGKGMIVQEHVIEYM
jgi:NADP-reducing hydrogenase subunit HndB